MKKSIKVFSGIIAGLALLAGATMANADCTVLVKVKSIYTVTYDLAGNNAASYSYVYLAPTGWGPTGVWWYGYTYDIKTANQLASAHAGNIPVVITGNASSCPASGTYRYIGQYTSYYSQE